jgi:hypothetical protein
MLLKAIEFGVTKINVVLEDVGVFCVQFYPILNSFGANMCQAVNFWTPKK